MKIKSISNVLYILFLLVMIPLFLCLTLMGTESQEDQKKINKWKDDLAKYQTPIEPIKLKYSYSLPSEKDSEKVYFYALQNFTVDEKGFVYVSDSQNSMVAVFNADKKFKMQFGSEGQGPGEFNRPKSVCIDESGQIIVLDSNNARIQFFSSEGVYKNSVKLPTSYIKMAVKNHKLYLFKSIRREKEKLIHVFNYDGKELYTFGDNISKYTDLYLANLIEISINDENEIFLAWTYLPIVRKYSEIGNLLAEYPIDYPIINNRVKQNKKTLSGNPSSSSERIIYNLISNVHAKKDGFYLMRFYPIIEFLKYDQTGKLIGIYHADQPYDLRAPDFHVSEIGNKIYFYIANNFPDDQIDVFVLQKTEIR